VSESATNAERLRAVLAMARSAKGVTVLQITAVAVSNLDAILAAFDPMHEALKAYGACDVHRGNCDDCTHDRFCMTHAELWYQAQKLRIAALSKAEGRE
jgi:hypothetical protein